MAAGVRLRRSLLYTPATRADRWVKALAGPADIVVADLEDGVPAQDKDAAREALVDAFHEAPRGSATCRAVRINGQGSPWSKRDLAAIAPLKPDAIVLPKCEDPRFVRGVGAAAARACPDAELIVMVETAKGLFRAREVCGASKRVAAVIFGGEDYAADVGARRSLEATELLFARQAVVAAAAATGIDAIDIVTIEIHDLDRVRREAAEGAGFGFRGKQVIHPVQVPPVHEGLAPAREEVLWAERVLEAVEKAGAGDGGVVVVDGRMVDRPVIAQAERVMAQATRR